MSAYMMLNMYEHWNQNNKLIAEPLLDYTIGATISHPNAITKVQSNSLDNDILNSANLCADTILTQLTPPHSPPQNGASPAFPSSSTNHFNDASTIISAPIADPIVPLIIHQAIATSPVQNIHHFSSWHDNNGSDEIDSNDDTIALAAQLIDDIVKTRAEELCYFNDECESQSSYSQADSMEWTPDTSSTSSSSSLCSSGNSTPVHLNNEDANGVVESAKKSATKKRTRPYGRAIEDRKIRKKEQNKNAATRYRQKKKLEMECVLGEEHVLAQRHDELSKNFSELKREAKYLKQLLRELHPMNKQLNKTSAAAAKSTTA